MSVFLGALAALLGGVLALVLLALATPVQLSAHAEWFDRPRGVLRLRLFGGLTPWLTLADTAQPARARRTGIYRAGTTDAGPRGRIRSETLWRLLHALPECLVRIRRRIHIDRLSIEADLGLGDPADTGQLFGYLMPLNHAIALPRTRIAFRPDFSRARIEGRAEAVLRLIPLSLMIPVMQLAWRVWVRRQ